MNYLGYEPLAFVPALIGTLQAEPPTPTQPRPTSAPTPTRTARPQTSVPTTEPSPTPIIPSEDPIGKIVFTCQVFRNENRNQICIMNGDGSNQRRLTTDDLANHFYASFAPDGQSIVFSSNQDGAHEIYEMDLDGDQARLTFMGELYAPEISPDGRSIVFTNSGGDFSSIWVMDRDGSSPRRVYGVSGAEAIDPTWSPDGKRILFALGVGDDKELHTVRVDGSGLEKINGTVTTRGRSDWSPDGMLIAGYTGGTWQRTLFTLNVDGSRLAELFGAGNAQAPAFSPDGGWVTFTGYMDNMGNTNGCEIYALRLHDTSLLRLTENNYCDWQPRWGP